MLLHSLAKKELKIFFKSISLALVFAMVFGTLLVPVFAEEGTPEETTEPPVEEVQEEIVIQEEAQTEELPAEENQEQEPPSEDVIIQTGDADAQADVESSTNNNSTDTDPEVIEPDSYEEPQAQEEDIETLEETPVEDISTSTVQIIEEEPE